MQAPVVNPQMSAPTPTYNAVKIDILNPHVNAPEQCKDQPSVDAPIYNVPKQSVYEVPSNSIYTPKAVPAQDTPAPAVPAPVIIPQAVAEEPAKAPVATPAATPAAEAPKPEAPATAPAPAPVAQTPAEPQKVEVKAPQNPPSSGIDVDKFSNDIVSPDANVQEKALEDVANMAQNNPEKAKDLLNNKMMTALTTAIQQDTSKLEGPSQAYLTAKEKEAKGEQLNDADKAELEKVSPKEMAETNKKYALFTTAMLQKLYGDNIEKMYNSVVPLTELPASAVVVEQIKSNPSAQVRAAAIDSLSYLQRPEYKKDLNTIFTLAQKDNAPEVQKAVDAAMKGLSQVSDVAPAAPQATDAKPDATATEAPKADAKDAEPAKKAA